ncbi:MAG TPA: YdeI/OmpD-associated family protein [Roseiarcus sp.]|nr:YdeI/OmpD-associated family protein [Roseiarcus sp.]
MPEDLRRALAASPAARRFFDRLDSANRYAILYRLHHAKDGAPRAARLAKFIAMLEAGETFHPLRAKRGRKSD